MNLISVQFSVCLCDLGGELERMNEKCRGKIDDTQCHIADWHFEIHLISIRFVFFLFTLSSGSRPKLPNRFYSSVRVKVYWRQSPCPASIALAHIQPAPVVRMMAIVDNAVFRVACPWRNMTNRTFVDLALQSTTMAFQQLDESKSYHTMQHIHLTITAMITRTRSIRTFVSTQFINEFLRETNKQQQQRQKGNFAEMKTFALFWVELEISPRIRKNEKIYFQNICLWLRQF